MLGVPSPQMYYVHAVECRVHVVHVYDLCSICFGLHVCRSPSPPPTPPKPKQAEETKFKSRENEVGFSEHIILYMYVVYHLNCFVSEHTTVQVQYMHIQYCASLIAAYMDYFSQIGNLPSLWPRLSVIAIFAIVFCFALISDICLGNDSKIL